MEHIVIIDAEKISSYVDAKYEKVLAAFIEDKNNKVQDELLGEAFSVWGSIQRLVQSYTSKTNRGYGSEHKVFDTYGFYHNCIFNRNSHKKNIDESRGGQLHKVDFEAYDDVLQKCLNGDFNLDVSTNKDFIID